MKKMGATVETIAPIKILKYALIQIFNSARVHQLLPIFIQ